MNLTSEEKKALDIVMNNKNIISYIKKTVSEPKKAKELKIGDSIEIDKILFSKFTEDSEGNAYMIADKAICKMEFGKSDDWRDSPIRTMLNTEFYDKIIKIIGKDSLVTIESDLLSFDGLKDYGKCKDLVSLLSLDLYRKNSKNIKEIDALWWLLTPNTLYSSTLLNVCNKYGLEWCLYNKILSVRPFIIIKSDIYVQPALL